MKKDVLEGGSPSRRRGAKTGSGKSNRKNSAKRTAGEAILDDDVDLEDEDIDLAEEIDTDELSDMLEDMEQEGTDDIASRLVKDEEDEESRNTRELMKYSDRRPGRSKSSRVRMETREDESEGAEEKPRTRWFMTTCPYCGNIYRFRSDQIQPPTCGKPQCVARFEERMKKKAAMAVA